MAEATAKELPRLSLADALELTALVAQKDRWRHSRVAGRWLLRYLDEREEATLDEAAMVAGCLAALGGYGHKEAMTTLQAMAERATRRRRTKSAASA
jgi:hypothetical protein